jgi:ABC-type nitrate/sulfonate/bicarbonate transport system permease component
MTAIARPVPRRVWDVLDSGPAVYVRTMAVFIAAWELGAIAVGNSLILPPPHEVAAAFWRLLLDGSIVEHAWTSVSRLLVAYAITAVIGFPLGLLMGLSRIGFELFDPVIELLRPISSIAWIPIALALLGVGYALPVFILVYVSIFPLILNTIAGVRETDPVLLRAARTMGLSRATIIRQVILPSALPTVLTGARLSAGLGWMALIAAELVGAPSGLGFAIQFFSGLFRSADMVAMIAVVALLGFLTDQVLRWIQKRVTPWSMR